MIYHRMLNTVACAIQLGPVFIHPIYNSWHLLTPVSHSCPPPCSAPSVNKHKSVPYVPKSVSAGK